MKFMIGCPMKGRAWIVEHWYNHIKRACEAAGILDDVMLVAIGPRGDEGIDLAFNHAVRDGIFVRHLMTREVSGSAGLRHWTDPVRLQEMVSLRNELLGIVRSDEPDFFLSVDSDILLHEQAIRVMLEAYASLQHVNAVGGKAYMTNGTSRPSYAMYDPATRKSDRPDSVATRLVDVIMAIKLMDPVAYNVDYVYHKAGEDYGWSINCRNQGIMLGWTGQVVNRHVMHQSDLTKDDKKVFNQPLGWLGEETGR